MRAEYESHEGASPAKTVRDVEKVSARHELISVSGFQFSGFEQVAQRCGHARTSKLVTRNLQARPSRRVWSEFDLTASIMSEETFAGAHKWLL